MELFIISILYWFMGWNYINRLCSNRCQCTSTLHYKIYWRKLCFVNCSYFYKKCHRKTHRFGGWISHQQGWLLLWTKKSNGKRTFWHGKQLSSGESDFQLQQISMLGNNFFFHVHMYRVAHANQRFSENLLKWQFHEKKK